MNIHPGKTIIVLAIVSLMTAGSVLAQNQKGERDWHKAPPNAEAKLARISAALELSDQQAIDMLVVLQEQEQKRAALHEQSMIILGPEICVQRIEAEQAILAILTPEQAETFLQHREERQEKSKEREHPRRGRGDLDCSDYEGGDS